MSRTPSEQEVNGAQDVLVPLIGDASHLVDSINLDAKDFEMWPTPVASYWEVPDMGVLATIMQKAQSAPRS
ncbi:hypothetical protein [Sporisorium scitamineum]|uniref:Uncharacterized protein n=1 Tax=Sporisorium scitamineum TaxID=49012 RepID=A0A0F7S3F2_9BASI|nr:hypothetical protein [Sporisorium scitamineum]